MTTSLKLDVDTTRFLAHLPQFFSSLGSALAEMLQNSTRAHATTVDITIARTAADDAWVLTVADDGPGVSDPQNLFMAARTGWDESQVIEPAGMGFFALLGLSKTLTVTSRSADGTGWQAVVTAQAFDGTPFVVTPLPPLMVHSFSSSGSGLMVQAILKPEANVSVLFDSPTSFRNPFTWRHAYPVTVNLHRPNDKEPRLTVPAQFDPESHHALPTPVGILYGRPDHNARKWGASSLTVIWEHRLIQARTDDLIEQLAERHGNLGKMVVRALPTNLVWVLPADTPVRAQLPERSALITNTAWRETVAQLADALVASFQPTQVLEAVQAQARSLPDVLSDSSWRPSTPEWSALPSSKSVIDALCQAGALAPFFFATYENWLEWAGYVEQLIDDPFNENGDWEGDNPEGYLGLSYRLWMKNVPVTPDEYVANQLCWHGFWTEVADPVPGASVMTVACQDLEWAPANTVIDRWLSLGRARQIVVQRDGHPVGTLPWWIQTTDDNETVQLIVADQGDRCGYGVTVAYPLPLLIQYTDYFSVTFWEYVYGGELDFNEVTAQITRTALALWDRQAADAQEAHEWTHRVLSRWYTVRSEAQALLELVPDRPEWVTILTDLLALDAPAQP